MEETKILSEEIGIKTQTVSTEDGDEGVTVKPISLGKFKDVNALLNAYNSLEAEFTKRCQRIKELEGNNDKAQAPLVEEVPQEKAETPKETEEKVISEEEKREILQAYLKEVLEGKQTAIIIDDRGVGVRAPLQKPKTIAEAGKLAKQIL